MQKYGVEAKVKDKNIEGEQPYEALTSLSPQMVSSENQESGLKHEAISMEPETGGQPKGKVQSAALYDHQSIALTPVSDSQSGNCIV